MKNSPLKFTFLLVSTIFLLGSCSDDPKEGAVAYFESVRYDVYLPSNNTVEEQQKMIQEFLDALKAQPKGDHMDMTLSLWKIGNKAVQDLENGISACDNMWNFGDKTNLLQATKVYMNKILRFEKELAPTVRGIQGMMDFDSFLKFSIQLKKGKEIEEAGKVYKKAQSDFRKEYGITELDIIKMRARH